MGGSILSGRYLNEPICFNKNIIDMIILVLFPPLWVFMSEYNKKKST